jgi:hypothetical protein
MFQSLNVVGMLIPDQQNTLAMLCDKNAKIDGITI